MCVVLLALRGLGKGICGGKSTAWQTGGPPRGRAAGLFHDKSSRFPDTGLKREQAEGILTRTRRAIHRSVQGEDSMFKMLGILFLALAAAAGDAQAAGLRGDVPENGRLLRLVVLSRHGVRSPTQSPEELARGASRPWPR